MQGSPIHILIKMAFAVLYSSESFNCALATNAMSIHTAHICQGVTRYIAVGQITPHSICQVAQI